MDKAGSLERLPPRLRRRVEVTGGGELIWHPDAVVEAIRWAAAEGLAVLGTEIFVGAKQARGLLARDTSTRLDWSPSEPWTEFVKATAAEATEAVRRDLVRRRAARSKSADPMYFVATTREGDYGRVIPHG